jgi:hypothetical protein
VKVHYRTQGVGRQGTCQPFGQCFAFPCSLNQGFSIVPAYLICNEAQIACQPVPTLDTSLNHSLSPHHLAGAIVQFGIQWRFHLALVAEDNQPVLDHIFGQFATSVAQEYARDLAPTGADLALSTQKKLTKSQTTGMLVTTKDTKAKNGTSTFCWPTENCGLVQRSSKQKRNPPASLRE